MMTIIYRRAVLPFLIPNQFPTNLLSVLVNRISITFSYALLIAFIVSNLGCATNSGKVSNIAINPEMSQVVIYSQPDSAWQRNASIGAALIVVDDKEVGRLNFGQKALLQLKPGTRKIKVYVNSAYPLIPVIPKINVNWDENLVFEKNQKVNLTLIYKEQTDSYIYDSQTYMFKSRMEEPDVKLSFEYSE